jgi:hypothetical protein
MGVMLAVSKQLLLPPLVVHVDWAKNVFVVGIRIRRSDTAGEATNECLLDTESSRFHAESSIDLYDFVGFDLVVLNTSCLYASACSLTLIYE